MLIVDSIQQTMKILIFPILIFGLVLFIASCSKDSDDNNNDTPGPKFLAVKSVIDASCATSGCHTSSSAAGGLNFENNSVIAANSNRIKTAAVDLGTMPPGGTLSASDKAKITEWVAAGGKITD